MKTICCIRGGQVHPLVKAKDSFDSKINVFDGDNQLLSVPFVNTDFFNGYKGGILFEDNYAFICGTRSDTDQKVLFLFDQKYYDEVEKRSDLTEVMRVLPSIIPNPNHNGIRIITQVLIHCDGPEGGWSNGCQTIYPPYWKDFIDQFKTDEKGIYSLRRMDGWKAPEFYQGN
jgi:hypothetical protein